MLARRVSRVKAHLVFLLIAQNGKGSNERDELVVAKSLEAGNGLRGRAERKCQGKAQRGVASFSQMQSAGAQGQRGYPRGAEDELLPDYGVEIVIMCRYAGRWQRSLLHEGVIGGVVIERHAQEHLCTSRLRPVQPQTAQVIAEGRHDIIRHSNRLDTWNESPPGEIGQRLKLSQTGPTISDAGALIHKLEGREEP